MHLWVLDIVDQLSGAEWFACSDADAVVMDKQTCISVDVHTDGIAHVFHFDSDAVFTYELESLHNGGEDKQYSLITQEEGIRRVKAAINREWKSTIDSLSVVAKYWDKIT